MNIKLDTVLQNLDGRPLLAPPTEAGAQPPPLTVAIVLLEALLSCNRETDDAKAKHRRWELAKAIRSDMTGVLSVTPEEAIDLKEVVSSRFAVIVTGQFVDILNKA